MREFRITQHLLNEAIDKAKSRRILNVHLRIGSFSEEREESIRFYWRDLAKGSFGEGAELHFERMPVQIKCLNCAGAFYLDKETSMCEFCYGERSQVLSGEDVRLESIELQ
jgi:hydrogenase nickel incorporation protein HypA/HybF